MIFMIMAILATTIFIPTFMAEANDSDVLFADDFSTYTGETSAEKLVEMEEKGWNLANSQTLAGYLDTINDRYSVAGVVHMDTAGAKGAYGWNDYVVSAKVTIGSGDIGGTDTDGNVYVGIGGRAIARDRTGYELAIYKTVTKAGVVSTGVRLYRRANADASIDGKTLKDVKISLDQGKEYKLDLAFSGNRIYGYLDGERIISVTDDNYAVGWTKIYASYKNAPNVKSDFDDFNVAKKTVPNYIFHADFNAYDECTWGTLNNATKGFIGDSSLVISSDKNNTIGANTSALTQTDYTIETEITVGDGTTTADLYVGVIGRTGYEFCVKQVKGDGAPTVWRLRRLKDATDTNSNLSTNVNLGSGNLSDKNITLKRGESFVLKMVFEGSSVSIYCNGTKLTSKTDSNYTTGYAGLAVSGHGKGASVTYDNFVVYDHTYTTELIGDVNIDALVNVDDITKLIDILCGKCEKVTQADVNKDKAAEVDILDLIRIEKLVDSL